MIVTKKALHRRTVLRGAAAEVEDYSRVTVTCPSQAALQGPAVADVIHLLAESRSK